MTSICYESVKQCLLRWLAHCFSTEYPESFATGLWPRRSANDCIGWVSLVTISYYSPDIFNVKLRWFGNLYVNLIRWPFVPNFRDSPELWGPVTKKYNVRRSTQLCQIVNRVENVSLSCAKLWTVSRMCPNLTSRCVNIKQLILLTFLLMLPNLLLRWGGDAPSPYLSFLDASGVSISASQKVSQICLIDLWSP